MKFLYAFVAGIVCSAALANASVELNTARIAYYNLRDCDRARNACLSGIEKGEKHWELYAILAGCELDAGKWQDAADALIQALEVDSASTMEWVANKGGGELYFFQAFYFTARGLFDEVHYDQALHYLDYAELFDPLNTDVYILRGAVLYKSGRFEEANGQYQRVHELDPENPDINFLIARALFEAEAFESSLTYFNEALHNYLKEYDRILLLVFQNLPEVDNTLAQDLVRFWAQEENDSLDVLLTERLRFDRGVDVHEAVIREFYRISMDLSRTHYFAGMAYKELGNDSLALDHLKRSLHFNADDGNALYYTGEISVQCALYDQAIPCLERAVVLQPDDLHAWFYLGVCYAQCGDYEKAIDVFEGHVLRLDPENIEALTNLVYVYGEVGDHDKAIEYTLRLNELKSKKN